MHSKQTVQTSKRCCQNKINHNFVPCYLIMNMHTSFITSNYTMQCNCQFQIKLFNVYNDRYGNLMCHSLGFIQKCKQDASNQIRDGNGVESIRKKSPSPTGMGIEINPRARTGTETWSIFTLFALPRFGRHSRSHPTFLSPVVKKSPSSFLFIRLQLNYFVYC